MGSVAVGLAFTILVLARGAGARSSGGLRVGLGRWISFPRPARSALGQPRTEVEHDTTTSVPPEPAQAKPAQPQPPRPKPGQPELTANRWLPPGIAPAPDRVSGAPSPKDVSTSNDPPSLVDHASPTPRLPLANLVRAALSEAVARFSSVDVRSAPARLSRRIGARVAARGGPTTIQWPVHPAPGPPAAPLGRETTTGPPIDLPLEPVDNPWLPSPGAQSPEPSAAQPPVSDRRDPTPPSGWRPLAELIRSGDADAAARFYDAHAELVRSYCAEACRSELIDSACDASFVDFVGRVRTSSEPYVDLEDLLLKATRAAAAGRFEVELTGSTATNAPRQGAGGDATCAAMPELLAAQANNELFQGGEAVPLHAEHCRVCQITTTRMKRAEHSFRQTSTLER